MKAILAQTTTDRIKSKILSGNITELVFEVYITPKEFAGIIEKYIGREFELILNDEKENPKT